LCGKTAFRILDCSFNKNNNGATRQNRVNFWEPNLSIFFLLLTILFNLDGEIVENTSDLSWVLISLCDCLISLSKYNCWSDLYIKLLKSLWAGFGLNCKILDIMVITKNVDGVIKVVEELNRGLIIL
jgi:hypothetical protein